MGQYYIPMIIDENNKPIATIYTHDFGQGLKLMEHSYVGNPITIIMEGELFNNPQRVVWACDYADNEPEKEENLYQIADNNEAETNIEDVPERRNAQYVVNHTKRQYIVIPPEGAWAIHPLPLLTAEGNGRGGGDFHGNDTFVGTWARDLISVTGIIPADFALLTHTFAETR